ncbi:hypothetical protein [Fusobacterium necrophorum]|uniref:hypothetical protein n=1 Tax=Fusobacterium necrophorum TaxID=859 RepID=UPI000D11C939|nr:hypothetical protein [Fusobacterium necrophorum]AVQ20721.1 hypothetical protein C4N15_03310 [Fusobacterium necrophorum subsp. funduliforme]
MNVPLLDEALKIVNKFVPDKDAQVELEKELRRLDIEDAKTKQKLFEKIIPITFPLCVWIGCGYCAWGLILSILAFILDRRYIFFEVNVPSFLLMCCGMFGAGLWGKKNIGEYFRGKNGGDKE